MKPFLSPLPLEKSKLVKVFVATALFASVLIASSAAVSQPAASQTTSDIVFTAPTGLIVGRNHTLAINASNSVADGSNTITCADATGVDATKMTVTRGTGANACTFTVDPVNNLAPASQGDATFSVLFTSSGGDTETGTFTVNIGPDSNIRTVNIPNPLRFNSNVREHKVNFSRFATDGDYEIFCTSVTATLGTISNRAADSCIFDYRLSFAFGTSRFNVSFRSAGGSTTTTSFRFNITTATFLNSFSFPAQNVVVGSTTDLEAGNHISITSFYANNYFCFDPTNIDSKITVILRGCRYIITGVTAGTASFNVNFRVTDGAVRSAAVTVNVRLPSNIVFNAPTGLEVGRNRTLAIDASEHATDSSYTITCGDATGVDNTKLTSVTQVTPPGGCVFTVDPIDSLAAGSQGDTTFSVPFTSSGGDTETGTFTVNIGPDSNVVFTAPSGLSVAAGRVLVIDASDYASDGSYTITGCAAATGVDSKITVSNAGCSYGITAGSTAGTASFTVPYTSSGGDTENGAISVTITRTSTESPVVALDAAGCTDGTFVDTTANPRVLGANNDLVEDCQALVAIQNHWAAVAANRKWPSSHNLRQWGVGTTQKIDAPWPGVTITSKRVTELALQHSHSSGDPINSSSSIHGTLPAELGDLTALTSLLLNDNILIGDIPTDLGNLTNLTDLYLSTNQLTGTIPTQLGSLTDMIDLELNDNQLTGAIPTQLGSLTDLEYLHLDDNRLSGSIPSQLGSLTEVFDLHLSNNLLSGTIPQQLSSLTTVRSLRIDNNRLTGSIPSQLGSLSNTLNSTGLDICENYLTGAIPTALRTKLRDYPTASGYDPIACQNTGTPPTATSDITYTPPALVPIEAGRSEIIDALAYVNDDPYTITCADATGKTASLTSVTRDGCLYTITAGSTAGDGSFTIPYTSSGTDTQNGLLNVKILPASVITYTPASVQAATSGMTLIDVSSLASDGSYAVSCGDAKSIDSKLSAVTRRANTCIYSVTVGSTAGAASFVVPYTSTGGAALDATVSITIVRPLSVIVFKELFYLDLATNQTLTIDASDYASDAYGFTISCGAATGVDSKITIQRTGCSFVVTPTGATGTAVFTVPYTSSGGGTYNAVFAIDIGSASAIAFSAPSGLTLGTNRSMTLDASSYAADASYLITCGDATGVDSKIAVTRPNANARSCEYAVTPTGATGTASFTVPYTSSGGHTTNGTISIAITAASAIVYSAPTGLTMTAGSSMTINAASYATDGSYTITCGDAAGRDAKIARITNTGCSYEITSGETTGTATFTVPYTSSGGDALNGQISVAITARARNVAPVFDRQSMMCGMLGYQPVRHSTADRITEADSTATFCRTPTGIICLRGSYQAEMPNRAINAIGLETSLDSCYNSIS